MTFRNSHNYSEPGLVITVFKKKEGEERGSNQTCLGVLSTRFWKAPKGNIKKKKKSLEFPTEVCSNILVHNS